MHLHFNALGFTQTNKEWMTQITREVYESPDKRYVLGVGESETYAEYYKLYGKDFGVKISCTVFEKDEVNVFDIDTYVQNGETLSICDIFIDGSKKLPQNPDEQVLRYAICEEQETGIELELVLQNTLDYMKQPDQEEVRALQVKVTALAMNGTIVLPIEKHEEDVAYEAEYRQWYQDQLRRAREGDGEADAVLDNELYEAAEEIYERLQSEDFLSVVEGYLYHDDDRHGIYFVLGDIQGIEQLTNSQTQKEVYKLLVRVMSIKIHVYVAKDELVGFPICGMRFMGVCRMQGEVFFA